MNVAVIQFPGSNCDQDCVHIVRNVCGHSARLVWHKDTELGDVQAVLVPGGFSYGDYLRTGCIARFSPVMRAVQQFAANGGPVLGICNGFQILCEAGLLPGALVRNRSLQFRCEHVYLKTLTTHSPFTHRIPTDRVMRIPIAHGDGCYFVDEETLAVLRERQQILWQYCDQSGRLTEASNPNGSIDNIAGVCNEQRNVAGLMPHPERASEAVLGCDDGRFIFNSLLEWLQQRSPAAAAT